MQNLTLNIETLSTANEIPSAEDFQTWANALCKIVTPKSNEASIRIIDEAEMIELNQQYRNQAKPTNVLSFPSIPIPGEAIEDYLGDIAICAPVVAQEAKVQQKAIKDHWAHMTIHGILHLMGYDHIKDDEAETMEGLETKILEGLGIQDPY